jgi:hypothetical protein
LPANRTAGRLVKPAHRLLQHTMAHRGRAHHQSAVGNGLGNGLKLFRLLQQVRGTHGGASLAKSFRKRIHQAQPVRAEVAHGSRRSANVQRITRAHQHDHEAV